ncbi:MAG: putative sulfate/molybdate transporter [Candidatus Omnitrophica bacterium]|nr:putative sulfate/molybdate transporter [Candidatus Omnitrophota bacterium]
MNTQGCLKNKYSLQELSGSLGDLGLFIPLVLAMAITCDMDLSVILILAGLMNIATGLIFRQPIPVQPMKAIAAIVIAESLSRIDIIAAGIIMGLTILALSPYMDRISKFIPMPIVRGIQLGIGLKLVSKSAADILRLNIFGWDSLIIAIIILITILAFAERKFPVLLYVFLFGFICIILDNKNQLQDLVFGLPQFKFYWPQEHNWQKSFFYLALPQIPLTILNSVIAVCALSSEYYPKNGILPSRMAKSVGLMNLITVPLGGIPLCHGAGGLAAQYSFGARTGGSVVMLGIAKVLFGLMAGSFLMSFLHAYPKSILSAMLIFAGLELARASRGGFSDTKNSFITLLTGGFILGIDTWLGFIAGCSAVLIIKIRELMFENKRNCQ